MNIFSRIGWRTRLGIFLVILSIVLYTIDFFIFRKPDTLFFYIGVDLAFIPIEVLVVVLVIETAISEREKGILLEKLNMVIGAFFSELGVDLLHRITLFDPDTSQISDKLLINDAWTENDFLKARNEIKDYDYTLILTKDDASSIQFLEETKKFLVQNRKFLLALLENPNLLEHETFTELLRGVFHLTEELEHRKDLKNLSQLDYNHLAGDIQRAYELLIYEWLLYMEHLATNYPYLFSLAIRMNPFNPEAKVEF